METGKQQIRRFQQPRSGLKTSQHARNAFEYLLNDRFMDNIGSYRRPETEQGIEGKIDRFRLGRVKDRVRVRFRSPI